MAKRNSSGSGAGLIFAILGLAGLGLMAASKNSSQEELVDSFPPREGLTKAIVAAFGLGTIANAGLVKSMGQASWRLRCESLLEQALRTAQRMGLKTPFGAFYVMARVMIFQDTNCLIPDEVKALSNRSIPELNRVATANLKFFTSTYPHIRNQARKQVSKQLIDTIVFIFGSKDTSLARQRSTGFSNVGFDYYPSSIREVLQNLPPVTGVSHSMDHGYSDPYLSQVDDSYNSPYAGDDFNPDAGWVEDMRDQGYNISVWA